MVDTGQQDISFSSNHVGPSSYPTGQTRAPNLVDQVYHDVFRGCITKSTMMSYKPELPLGDVLPSLIKGKGGRKVGFT